jgi:hypothetical protein
MPLTADERILLIRAKVERAKKHFRDLEVELISFGKQHSYVLTGERNNDSGKINGPYFQHRLPIIPVNILTAAGDVIHNLRSALDHLAYQLVAVGSPGSVPSRRAEFPIAKDFTTYKAETPRKVEGMTPEAVEAINRLKPYKGGNEALWRIHELNNIDKHRMLFAVGGDWLLRADWFPTDFWFKASDPHFVGAFASDVEKNIDFAIEEPFGDPEIVNGNALLPTLKELINFVDYTILLFRPYLE